MSIVPLFVQFPNTFSCCSCEMVSFAPDSMVMFRTIPASLLISGWLGDDDGKVTSDVESGKVPVLQLSVLCQSEVNPTQARS